MRGSEKSEMFMQEMPDRIWRAVESGPLNASCWPSDFMEKVQSVSLVSHGETSNFKEAKTNHEVEGSASWSASQTLWATGMLSEPISNGFYCVILERKLKVLFDSIPSPDELNTLDSDGLKAEVIIVNREKDKTLSMLKQLIATLVKGVNSNPVAIIKKIAGLNECKDQSEEPERPGAIISNHVSYLDILYHMSSSYMCFFIAKRSVAKLPLVGLIGLISKFLGCVYVQRESKSSDFKGVSGLTGRGQYFQRGFSGALAANAPTEATSSDPLIGIIVKTRWPEDRNFSKAVIMH